MWISATAAETALQWLPRLLLRGFNPADFQGNADAERVRINKWVEDETHDRIKDLIPPGGVNASTTLVLTNAVYFKGLWGSQFDAKQTRPGKFHIAEDETASVPMMWAISTPSISGVIVNPFVVPQSLLLMTKS